MNAEEYKSRLDELKKKHHNEINELYIEYAKLNNPHKVGDIVTDDMGSIILSRIKVTLNSDKMPCCLYYGPELTKKGVVRKDNKFRAIHQSRVKPVTN